MLAGRTEEDELARTLALEQQIVPAGYIAPLLAETSDPFSASPAPSSPTGSNNPGYSIETMCRKRDAHYIIYHQHRRFYELSKL
jgi:hypothetical protein